MTVTKTVVEIPLEDYNEGKELQRKILSALENLKIVSPPELLSRKEFMQKCRIASTKFHELRKSGKLKYRKVGRMVYVPSSEVDRFFNGELQ